MDRQKRLTGIDLFRGLAIFAVVILHSDEGIKVIPHSWSQIADFALFAVPFFLALSFYLAIDKLWASYQSFRLWARLARLLIPYSLWSAIYVFYKVTKYSIAKEPDRLIELFHDPLSLVCFGGAAFHLYFLPLLASGTVLVKLSEWAIAHKISLARLTLLCVVSLLIYEALLRSGNEFQLGDHQAFQPLLTAVLPLGNSNPLLRLILVIIAFMIRCVPYVMVSTILTHPSVNKFRLKFIDCHPILLTFIFLIINIFGSQFLPQSLYEIVRGYLALITAISVSSILKYNYSVESLGTCSFGIYFIHLIFVEIFQSLAKRVYPDYIYRIDTGLLLVNTLTIVVVSWGIIHLMMRNKRISKILF